MPLARALRFSAVAIRPILRAAVSTLALVSAGPASARAGTITLANHSSTTPPSCPANPCAVVSRTTAIQIKDGKDVNPFMIRRSGRIIAWSITLAVPSLNQVHYFDGREGGTSRAGLAILHNTGGLEYRLVGLSPVVRLQSRFGTTAQFHLAHPIAVKAGDVVALAVPTWVPALAVNYPATTSWRASRNTSQCGDVTIQTMQAVVGSSAAYECLYQTAQLTYAATEATG